MLTTKKDTIVNKRLTWSLVRIQEKRKDMF